MVIALALVASAWLAYATTAPNGSSGSSGGVTTTTVKSTTTTTIVCVPQHQKGDQSKGDEGQSDQSNGDAKANFHGNDKNGNEDGNQCPPVCKPGNGFGDKNHCHTGPPGQHH